MLPSGPRTIAADSHGIGKSYSACNLAGTERRDNVKRKIRERNPGIVTFMHAHTLDSPLFLWSLHN